MNAVTAYARLNIELKNSDVNPKAIEELQELLYDAAIWGGADDAEVFYIESKNLVGVSIPVDEHPASVLEAGSVLGMCQRTWEESDSLKGTNWLSLATLKGEIMYSPLGF